MDIDKIAMDLAKKLRHTGFSADSIEFYCAFVAEYWKYPKYLGIKNIQEIYYKTRNRISEAILCLV
jgi:hypothetical protein